MLSAIGTLALDDDKTCAGGSGKNDKSLLLLTESTLVNVAQ